MKVLAVETDVGGRGYPSRYVVEISWDEMAVITGADIVSQMPTKSKDFDICESYREGQRIKDAAAKSIDLPQELRSVASVLEGIVRRAQEILDAGEENEGTAISD